ncbi:MAG: endonuclease/exonuclease/phosphatase family metal-dependent hydrolase [Flavobacteriales bacterium]|jgi:endonuclease/exonuclease/phosphatase family metal-dependent hydrolase
MSQSAPIVLDGRFDDWTPGLTTFTDAPETISGVDLLSFQVTNDADFLYIKLETNSEFDLTDNLVNHNLFMYIDADNNSATGYNAQTGFGSEVGIDFNSLFAHYNGVVPGIQVDFAAIKLRCLPTVTSNVFEIAIGRDVLPNGINSLFSSSTIKILFRETSNGDRMPNTGQFLNYTFDETPVGANPEIEINKEDPSLVRVVAYNTLLNGLDNASQVDNFETIITLLNPDVIGFSEASGTSASTVKNLMDTWLPTGTIDGWYVVKDDYDLITASRWDFINDWPSLDRQHPVLIDLPLEYATDLLFVNSHLNCCSNETARQNQADEWASFMLDAKSIGGIVDLAPNTGFVYAGDLNLVGWAQQLNTLVTGDIQDTGAWGPAGALDWDNTDLTDQICMQTDKRTAYTWRKDSGGSYPPGRLDFIIYSDAVMSASKSFTLQTEIMPPARLATYGLAINDTGSASDHFPVVIDFSMEMVTADMDGDGIEDETDNCPSLANADQQDSDIDFLGDICDNCPNDANADQADWNANGIGDACEDSDSDGLLDSEEILNYLTDPTIQDSDGDGLTDGFEVSTTLSDPLLFDTDGDNCHDGMEWGHQCPDNMCGGCPGDFDDNGSIGTNDLLTFLGLFGLDCE